MAVTANGAIPWWEDETLKRKATVAVASVVFIVKCVVTVIKTRTLPLDGLVDAVFGLGVAVDVIAGIVKRLREGKDPSNPAPEIIPAVTPTGVRKAIENGDA